MRMIGGVVLGTLERGFVVFLLPPAASSLILFFVVDWSCSGRTVCSSNESATYLYPPTPQNVKRNILEYIW